MDAQSLSTALQQLLSFKVDVIILISYMVSVCTHTTLIYTFYPSSFHYLLSIKQKL